MIARMTAVFFGTVLFGVVLLGLNGGEPVSESSSMDSTPPSVPPDVTFEFPFPSGTRIVIDKSIVNGWRQTGFIPLPFESARQAVSDMLSGHGFTRMLEASDGHLEKCVIEKWRDAKGRTQLWMLWGTSDMETGFSWGEET